MIVIGIETSCDETAVAVCKDGKILSNEVSSQSIHSKYGGVVPEIASREHEKFLNLIADSAIAKAKISLSEIDAIAVTQGPGLAGTLLTGISFAKGLSIGLGIPLIPINHLEAHIFANFLADPNLKFPFVCLLVSGGHTQLWNIENMGLYNLLGETRDDAAGEAFDKGARILGLGYPGGPEIEKKAQGGDENLIKFPRSTIDAESLEFSFSGLKTSLLYYMDNFKETENITLADIAASYQKAIVDILIIKIKRAIKKTRVQTCVIAGGVAANKTLRFYLEKELSDTKILFPDISFCTDNAAMISFLGEIKFNSGFSSNINFSAEPNLQMV